MKSLDSHRECLNRIEIVTSCLQQFPSKEENNVCVCVGACKCACRRARVFLSVCLAGCLSVTDRACVRACVTDDISSALLRTVIHRRPASYCIENDKHEDQKQNTLQVSACGNQ